MHLRKARHFKASWKWQRLCCFSGETSPACFLEEAGVWVYHFSGSSKSCQRFPPVCFFLFLVGIVNRHRQECTQARSRLNERADFGRQEQKEPSSNQQLEQQCLNTFAFVPVLENRALRKLLCFSGTRIKSKKSNPPAETRGHDGIHSLSHLLGCRSDFIMYSLLPIVQTSIIFKAK